MKKICLHWSAGPYKKTSADFEHYHYMVDDQGDIDPGRFQPSDNIPPLKPGKYAAHCGGGNSYCIGVALTAMGGYQSPHNVGKYPITEKQGEAAWEFIAKLCTSYGIKVTPKTVFTHYEFGKANPTTSSHGKIDITFLPYEPLITADRVGDYIRQKVKWYMEKANASND